MSEIVFPIKRNELYGTYVYLFNRKLEILKKKIAVYHSEQDLIYSRSYENVYYDSPKYKVIADVDCRHNYFPTQEENRRELSIVIAKPLILDNLLYYAGFDETLDEQDLLELRTNVFNGKFAYLNCELFGYRKKPKEIMKNGIRIPNPANNLSDYDINKYELTKEKPIVSRDIFELLNEVEVINPNSIFEPFPEEGEIRARILK